MEIKFKTDQAFRTGHTYLFGHNFIFDTYKSERVMKFFYENELISGKNMLLARDIVEGRDYEVVS